MKLAPVSAIKEALGIGDGLDILDTSLASSLDYATETIAAYIQHEFAAVTGQADTFQIYACMRAGSNFRATMALRRGFITGTPTVVWAGSYAGLADPDTVDPTEYRVDAERGAVIIESATDWTDRYVRVTYNAGFAADGTDTDLFNQTVVPEWLRAAATLVASGNAVLLNPDLGGGGQGGGPSRDAKELTARGMAVAERHLRYFPSPIRPI